MMTASPYQRIFNGCERGICLYSLCLRGSLFRGGFGGVFKSPLAHYKNTSQSVFISLLMTR